MKLFELLRASGVYVLLVMLTVVDVSLFAYVRVAHHSIVTLPQTYLRDSSDVGVAKPPHGYSAEGTEIALPSVAGKGWVVRYATRQCEFCRADEQRWGNLKTQLMSAGYQIYEIPPAATQADCDQAKSQANDVHICFVDVEWVKRYRLSGTPTTIVFSHQGRAMWTHIGTLDDNSLKDALSEASARN